MTSMFDTFVDAVQGAKTQFVKTFVANDELKKPLQTYIDAQSTFAKKVSQEVLNFYTSVGTSAWMFDAKKAFNTK